MLFGRDGGSKEFVFHGFGGDARKLVGGGVMPVGGKPVRIFKMCVAQPECGRFLVHEGGKRGNIAGRRHGKRVCRVVA